MAQATILHPFVDGHHPERQEPCWRALRAAQDAGFAVEHIAVTARWYGYCTQLIARWNRPDDWIIVEHDIEPSIAVLESLRDCPEPLCTRPYAIFEGDDPFIDALERDQPPTSVGAPLGCTKLTAAARRTLARIPVGAWMTYDGRLTVALRNATQTYWHLHYEPLIHHHRHVPTPDDLVKLGRA